MGRSGVRTPPEIERRIVYLHDRQNLEFGVIAKRMGMSNDSVIKIYRRMKAAEVDSQQHERH